MEEEKEKFGGFPSEPKTNYWSYPKALNGYWHQLNGSEQKALDYILRHTWGFKKTADKISLNQFMYGVRNLDKGIGLSKPTLIKALKGLEDKGFIKTDKKHRKITEYELVFRVKDLYPLSKETLPKASKESLPHNKGYTIKDSNNTIFKDEEIKKLEKSSAINKVRIKLQEEGVLKK